MYIKSVLKNESKTRYILIGILLLLIFPIYTILLQNNTSAATGIYETINAQGKLVDDDGTNASATCIGTNSCDFRFTIYDADSGGNNLWQETHSDVTVTDGIFNVKLGSVTSLNDVDLENFNRDDLWVEIELDENGDGDFTDPNDQTFNPRTHMSSVAYAFNAKYVGGIASSGFIQLSPSSAQTTGNVSTSLIHLNENGTGSPNLLELEVAGSDIFTISNGGDITTTGNTTIANTKWIGLGSSAGRIVFDDDTTDYINLLNANVGIGTTVPNFTLDINGIIGINANQLIYHADALDSFTGTLFISNGGGSLSHTSGDQAYYNTALGINSLLSNTTGFSNTSIGTDALYSNTSGGNNTVLGYSTLYSNTTGENNIAIGVNSLYTNTTGNDNIAIGYGALYNNTASDNVAIGNATLSANTTGSLNVAIGYYVLLNNTTGNYNTAIGTLAGENITEGAKNTFVGYQVGSGITTGSNNTIIGSSVTGLASDLSNRIIIADGAGNIRIYSDNNGNIGIGTTSLSYLLEVNGTLQADDFYSEDGTQGGSTTTGGLTFKDGLYTSGSISSSAEWTDGGNYLYPSDNTGQEYIYIGGNSDGTAEIKLNYSGISWFTGGNVGIGTTNPSANLHIYRASSSSNFYVESDLDTGEAGFEVLADDSSNIVMRKYGSNKAGTYHDVSLQGLGRIASNSTNFMIDTMQDGNIIFAKSTGETMRINTSGNVGIGTTNPIANLHIYKASSSSNFYVESDLDTGEAGFEILADDSSNIVMRKYGSNKAGTYHDVSLQGLGRIASNSTNFMIDTMQDGNIIFAKSTGETMRINTSGNVGIGTTNPAARLTSFGTEGNPATSGTTITGHFAIGGYYNNNILTMGTQNASPYGSWLQTTNISDLSIEYPLLLNPNGGNVGIGTTTPYIKLNVNGVIGIGNGSDAYANQGHSVELLTDTTFGGVNDVHTGVRMYAYDMNGWGTAKLGIQTSTNWRTYETSAIIGNDLAYFSGNVGIGTTSPISQLEIVGDSAGASSVPELALTGGGYNMSDLYVMNSYNVNTGVGYAAKVIGVNLQNRLGTGNQVYLRANSGGITSAGAIYLGSDDVNQGVFGVLGATGAPGTELSHLLTVKSNGNVGIGTTNPSGTLQVHAASGYNSQLYLSDGDVAHGMTSKVPTNTYAHLDPASSTAGGLFIEGLSDTGTNEGLFFSGVLGSSNPTDSVPAFVIRGQKQNGTSAQALGSNETVLQIRNHSTNLVTILGSGNFGIGDTTPDYDLDVPGTIYAGTRAGDPIDVAEWIEVHSSNIKNGKNTIKKGELVCASNDDNKAIRCNNTNNDILGIVSTKPHLIMGEEQFDHDISVQLALAGRVPAIVAAFNSSSSINNGDSITYSPISGIGMKTTTTGPTAGKGLESTSHWNEHNCSVVNNVDSINWPSDDGTNPSRPCYRIPVSSLDASIKDIIKSRYNLSDSDYFYLGKIMVFINVSWHETEKYTSILNNIISDYDNGLLGGLGGSGTLDSITNLTITDTLNSNIILSNSGVFNSIEVDDITVNNNLSVHGLLTSHQIKTEKLYALSNKDIVLQLSESIGDTSFEIQNSEGEVVFSVDSDGKLSFSSDKEDSSVGTSSFGIGETEITIETSVVTLDSKVFVTPRDDIGNTTLYVEEAEEGRFKVIMADPKSYEVKFDWWVIN